MDDEKKYRDILKDIDPAIAGTYSEQTKIVLENIKQRSKESEDERIRKELWEYFHDMQLRSDCDFSPSLTIDDILAYLERQKEPRDYRKLYEEVVKSDWFKENYIGKSLGEEQKSAEWSKEDEKIRKTLLVYYEEALDNYTCVEWLNGITYGELCDWLKSIRPHPSWKPSEYMLSLVKKVADGEMLTRMEQMAMETLYDDLRKL